MFSAVSRVFAIGALAAAAYGATVTANIYTGSLSGDGTPFTGFVGTVTSSDYLFSTDNGGAWHPFGMSSFAADITGSISVAADGTYGLVYGSDDGSQLFIDGNSIADLPGDHGQSNSTYDTALTAGLHSVEIHFFENGVGHSGVDLLLPSGVTVADSSAPEPGTIFPGAAGIGLAIFHSVRRRRSARVV